MGFSETSQLGNQVRQILILLSFLLLTSTLFGQSTEKPCYISVNASDEFNQTLLSNLLFTYLLMGCVMKMCFPCKYNVTQIVFQLDDILSN